METRDTPLRRARLFRTVPGSGGGTKYGASAKHGWQRKTIEREKSKKTSAERGQRKQKLEDGCGRIKKKNNNVEGKYTVDI